MTERVAIFQSCPGSEGEGVRAQFSFVSFKRLDRQDRIRQANQIPSLANYVQQIVQGLKPGQSRASYLTLPRIIETIHKTPY